MRKTFDLNSKDGNSGDKTGLYGLVMAFMLPILAARFFRMALKMCRIIVNKRFGLLVAVFFAIGGFARADTVELEIPLAGSLQNAAWSPTGSHVVLTRFVAGYNLEPADVVIVALDTLLPVVLVTGGDGNINLPGSSWNAITGLITFSSTRGLHDEIYVIDATGSNGDEIQVTSRVGLVAYEPSFSPDGSWIVFESHLLDVETGGQITKIRADGSGSYITLSTVGDDCRQPNWSPSGELIVYQCLAVAQWDLWVTDVAGNSHLKITQGSGDKTDASFSPNGQWVVFSQELQGSDNTNLFAIPSLGGATFQVTFNTGYDGAPSWSPDGRFVVYEHDPTSDPDGGAGTRIWRTLVDPIFSSGFE